MSRSHELELRVRYAESDQMGVVYHANYLVWCEMGRTELIRTLIGRSYADLEREGDALAVSELSIRYHGAARYDDRVLVRTTIADVRSRSVAFEYHIANADTGERLASATTTLVSLDANGKPVSMPIELRRQMSGE
ncbi:MAG TPA: thioesterase family protein [Gemmatimonadaceae bacterium]